MTLFLVRRVRKQNAIISIINVIIISSIINVIIIVNIIIIIIIRITR